MALNAAATVVRNILTPEISHFERGPSLAATQRRAIWIAAV
jgi:hypothetical protein